MFHIVYGPSVKCGTKVYACLLSWDIFMLATLGLLIILQQDRQLPINYQLLYISIIYVGQREKKICMVHDSPSICHCYQLARTIHKTQRCLFGLGPIQIFTCRNPNICPTQHMYYNTWTVFDSALFSFLFFVLLKSYIKIKDKLYF